MILSGVNKCINKSNFIIITIIIILNNLTIKQNMLEL